MNFCAAKGLNATLFASVAQDIAGGSVDPGEELFIALNEGDLAAHAFEVMSHFQGDGAAAEDCEGVGQRGSIEDVVAGPKAILG